MLKNYVKTAQPDSDVLKQEIKRQQEILAGFQMKIKEAKLPVMVIFEGWGAAGKGSVISRVIKNIDPRFFKVRTFAAPTAEDKGYPFLYRYMLQIPEAGKFIFFDSYWMEEVTAQRMEGKLTDDEYRQRIQSINMTERSLTDNGYLVMKFFLHISKKEQAERMRGLMKNRNTEWRIDKDDKKKTRTTRNTSRLTTSISTTRTVPLHPGIS